MSEGQAAGRTRSWADAEVPESFERLLELVHQANDLGKTMAVLSWDREVNMPPGGAEARVQQIVTLARHVNDLATSDRFIAALEEAERDCGGDDADSAPARLLGEVRRSLDDRLKIGPELNARIADIGTRSHAVWAKARAEDDFESFEPWLDQVVGMGREIAERLGYQDDPYDALLDRFERGATAAEVERLLESCRRELVPLREAIDRDGRTIDDSMLHGTFPVDSQRAFVENIADAVGYDRSRGHIGTAVHPFATSFSRDDCRITTRWYPDQIKPSLFGTLHECGHAMYEQNTDPRFARTPLARGTSSGIHESQSRMVENLVGRRRDFWRAHFPALQTTFSEALGSTDAESFYLAINKVQPSLIRVEADELTYNLHIILRFNLERRLLDGSLEARDLPEAWREGMLELLGIAPDNDREGVLQDVHWTRPMFGYFPTYALGNLYAAQLFDAALEDDPAIEDDLATGGCRRLMAWLTERVHRHGTSRIPAEIIEDATGSPLSHTAFCAYAERKFRDVYAL